MADLASLDEWHYVGEAGEPAFGTDWGNAEAAENNLGFRIREAGVVDIQGYVKVTNPSASQAIIFTLPTGYRPSGTVYYSATALTDAAEYTPLLVKVNTSGHVIAVASDFSPFPGAGGNVEYVWLNLFAFLVPATTP